MDFSPLRSLPSPQPIYERMRKRKENCWLKDRVPASCSGGHKIVHRNLRTGHLDIIILFLLINYFFFLFSVDTMYAMAYALHQLVRDVCGLGRAGVNNSKGTNSSSSNSALCAELSPSASGSQLLEYIRNVTFTSKQAKKVQ